MPETDPISEPTAGRPSFHVTAPANWLSDPNGPVWWDGRYHVFYQHNPEAPVWGPMHWGHVSSADLVHWIDHGIALSPSAGGPDEDGCWSGCIRVVDVHPTMFYTGAAGGDAAHAESVCRAVSAGDLTHWTKDPDPLIPAVDPGLGLRQMRDPYLLWHADRWLMLLGTGVAEVDGPGRGAVVAFESSDLTTWEYRGVVLSRPAGTDPIDTGPVWECPQLVRLDGRWVLVVSVQMPGSEPMCPYAVWFVGDLDGTTFLPTSMGLVDHGDIYYAPALLDEPGDRVLQWGWLQDLAGDDGEPKAFAGALSLPRRSRVVDGRFVSGPSVELTTLGDASGRTILEFVELGTDTEVLLATTGPSFRLDFTAEAVGSVVGARIRPTGDGDSVLVAVDGRTMTPQLIIEVAGQDGCVRRLEARIEGVTAARPRIQVFVDHGIVEAFVEDGEAMSTRFRGGAADVVVHSTAIGGPGRLSSVELVPIRV